VLEKVVRVQNVPDWGLPDIRVRAGMGFVQGESRNWAGRVMETYHRLDGMDVGIYALDLLTVVGQE